MHSNALMTSKTRRIAGCMIAVAALALSACGDDAGDGAESGVTVEQTVGSADVSGAASPTGVTLLDPAEAVKLLDSGTGTGTGIVVIDVRTPSEFTAGHLANAVNIDVNGSTFAQDIAALDTSATYFVYCQSGRRSAIATQTMSDKGFTHVYELDGGIVAWLAAGQPVVTD